MSQELFGKLARLRREQAVPVARGSTPATALPEWFTTRPVARVPLAEEGAGPHARSLGLPLALG